MTYSFTIYGTPQPKGRPRFNRRTGTAYTPRNTHIYETEVKAYFLTKYPHQKILDTPLAVRIDAYFETAKSTSKRVREMMLAGQIRPVKKPDADNIIKSICDALNGIAYVDDSQIVCISCRKLYSDKARAEVTITELERPL